MYRVGTLRSPKGAYFWLPTLPVNDCLQPAAEVESAKQASLKQTLAIRLPLAATWRNGFIVSRRGIV